jgi:hypothetical protein
VFTPVACLPGTSEEFDFPDSTAVYIITAIDLVSQASAISGTADWAWSDGAHAHYFWVANLGINKDTFSWRGWLPIAGGIGESVTVENSSGGNLSGIVTGFQIPNIPAT